MWLLGLQKIFKNKITWIVLGSLVLLIVLWVVFKKKGKPNALPIPEGELTDAELQDAAAMADKLYNELKGWGNFDNNVAEEFAQMTDRMTIAVSNRFNEVYYEVKDRTLREWLDKESLSGAAGTFINDIVLPRMTRLNIE